MTYFVTIEYKTNAVFTEPESFNNLDDVVSYLSDKGYFDPPALPKTNAYAALDTNGLARISLSPSTAGLIHVPESIKTIFIRRADIHLLDMPPTC